MTSVQEIYENNLRRKYTAADGQQFEEAEKQLAANHLDVKAARSIDMIDEFFQKNRQVPVTVANIVRAVEERKSEFKWFSQAEFDYYAVANQEPDRANQLVNWLATQGKPGQLANSGDAAFDNLRLLLNTLRGYDITPPRIRDAGNRIQSKPGRKLRIVEAPRRTEPISRAAKEDDGIGFLHSDMVKTPDGSWRSKTPAEQRRDREAAERALSQTQTPALDASEQAWKNLADNLLHDGTHSQQERVRAVYDREQSSGWRKVNEACQREINLTKNRSVR
jgi:hypothetical protein